MSISHKKEIFIQYNKIKIYLVKKSICLKINQCLFNNISKCQVASFLAKKEKKRKKMSSFANFSLETM